MSSKLPDLNLPRCSWCLGNPLYIKYHDKEWGVPVHNDKKIFEFLILEGFQAGLSWLTILRKRGNFRKAFDGFNFNVIANYDKKKLNMLMKDSGIIRNRQKIEAAINNAKKFISVRAEFGTFAKYIWSFINNIPITNRHTSLKEIPAKTDISDRISKDLKNRGFKFVGSTIIYAHMQATGMVNDHLIDCFRYNEVIQ